MPTFTINGPPVPFARAGANGKRRFTPPKQKAAMTAIRYVAQPHFPQPMGGAIRLTVVATFALPASASRPEKARRLASGHTQKPDADNIGKLVKDALNDVAYYDDAQVSELIVRKAWGHVAQTQVTVEPCPAPPAVP